jgi:hypothetical protein
MLRESFVETRTDVSVYRPPRVTARLGVAGRLSPVSSFPQYFSRARLGEAR